MWAEEKRIGSTSSATQATSQGRSKTVSLCGGAPPAFHRNRGTDAKMINATAGARLPCGQATRAPLRHVSQEACTAPARVCRASANSCALRPAMTPPSTTRFWPVM